jgi:hypothetical protein
MAELEKAILSDKAVVPTDDFIFSLIGDKKILWQKIMNHISETYKDISGTWNYYNDGKQWLFKLVHKKKTIFWLGMIPGSFRITFYFGDKAEPSIIESDLPERIKEEFKSAKKYGAIRGITIVVNGNEDVDNILKIIALKYKMK